jgi:acyl-CoA thioester hydrolase
MRFPLDLRYNDYDTNGHVNNAVYLTYFEIARQRAWIEAMGMPRDFPFVIAEATVRYVKQAMLGDPLEIEVKTARIGTKSWDWAYDIVHAGDGALVARGSTVQVMFDYDAHRSIPVPDDVRARLALV